MEPPNPRRLERLRQVIWAAATLICLLTQSGGAHAREVAIAVATNFAETAERLKEVFESAAGDTLNNATLNRLQLIAQPSSKSL